MDGHPRFPGEAVATVVVVNVTACYDSGAVKDNNPSRFYVLCCKHSKHVAIGSNGALYKIACRMLKTLTEFIIVDSYELLTSHEVSHF
jgi:hypothetical protein